MLDRYDPRDYGRERGDSWERSFGSRGGSSERDREECSRDVFTKDLDLPRGRERRPVRERNRLYEINGEESRALATIGAFRVVAQSDLHDLRDDSHSSRRSLKHLENEGLIRTSPLNSEDRAVALADRGRDLLEANRHERDERSYEPRQAFYAGVRKPRELTHDTKVTDEPQERPGSVRGDEPTGSDGSSQAASPSQPTRAVPGRWEADHSARRLVTRSLRGAPGECADR